MFLYILVSLGLVVFAWCKWSKKQQVGIRSPDIPTVQGGLPIFGHSSELYEDLLGFMSNCHNMYGDFFRLKVNSAEYVVVLDPKVVKELTKKTEDQFSLYNLLNDELYFTSAFFNKSNSTEFYESLKKAVHVNTSNSTQILKEEVERMVHELKKELRGTKLNQKGTATGGVTLTFTQQENHFWRFAARSSSASLFHMEITEKAFLAMSKFSSLLHYALIVSTFVPNGLLDFLLGKIFSFLRSRIRPHFHSTIEKYEEDRNDGGSNPMRTFAETCDAYEGSLFKTQMGDRMMGSLFGSTKNSARCIQNVMVDLAQNPTLARELRSQLVQFVLQGNIDGILESELLQATLMETARLYSTVFGITRKVTNDTVLGGRKLKMGEVIVTCLPYLMRNEAVFKNPLVYNPFRFVGEEKESWSQHKILTWGAGTHLCPGKPFAIQTIKIAVAYLVTNFDLKLGSNKFNVQYSTTSSFADRKTDIIFTPIV